SSTKPCITLYPRMTTSPASPAGSDVPSSSTTCTSVPGIARPAVFEIVSGSSSCRHMVAMPVASVRPYPVTTVSNFNSSRMRRNGTRRRVLRARENVDPIGRARGGRTAQYDDLLERRDGFGRPQELHVVGVEKIGDGEQDLGVGAVEDVRGLGPLEARVQRDD